MVPTNPPKPIEIWTVRDEKGTEIWAHAEEGAIPATGPVFLRGPDPQVHSGGEAESVHRRVRATLAKAGLDGAFEVAHVDPVVLTDNLREFLGHFQALTLDPEAESESGLKVQEIELSLGVNGKGGFALLGKLEVGVVAGIKVKLVRRNPKG
jgi:hypothetical protein